MMVLTVLFFWLSVYWWLPYVLFLKGLFSRFLGVLFGRYVSLGISKNLDCFFYILEPFFT
jgi:hypothetical protein